MVGSNQDYGDNRGYQVPQMQPVPPAMPPGQPGFVPSGAQPTPMAAVPTAAPMPPAAQGASAMWAGPVNSTNPLMQQAAGVAAPPMAGPLPAAANGQLPATTQADDETVPVDDVVWINRAKRAITETQGDPYRQVQLIQHLRSQYLKQRFGRTVHTDDQVNGRA